MKCRRFRCPACGWFGRKARRRVRDAEDASHIAWAHNLVAPRPTPEPLTLWDAIIRADMAAQVAEAREAIDQHHVEQQRRLARRNQIEADAVAEVVGPLSYEEQSEMFGDPIADVIRKETP
ncbi:hypothetical protein AVJ28_gp93 [Mycobacterium phage Baee]|uniref:Uncharacterized protein n=2 Tax=Acadianvirus baee TaxID=1982902 RepID=A0A1L6BZ20_9CAUD|nr:hypothetical protein AVJ28_gp93 [Mycobacterium phage Baee]AKF14662.1 hypothetical protein SEA_BAEE_93 [Mycobacterium phage Baee]APQ42350.1 hypothetical protein PBI_RICH_92 [Mycobacterium phage Rich]